MTQHWRENRWIQSSLVSRKVYHKTFKNKYHSTLISPCYKFLSFFYPLGFGNLLTSEQENTKYSRTNHISLSLRRTKVHRVSIGKHSGSRDREAYACKSAQHDRDQYHPRKWAVFLPKLLRHHAFLLPAFQCFLRAATTAHLAVYFIMHIAWW